jgi:RNase P subunit RPR2
VVVDDAIEASARVDCPRCGIVEVPAERLRLRMSPHTGDRRSVVVFRCLECGGFREQRVDERTSRLLAAAGVVLEVPAMLPHQGDQL